MCCESLCLLSLAHVVPLDVLSDGLFVEGLVVEARIAGSDVVLLAHLEVLAEVLVSAPPVAHNGGGSLVPALLMEVGVSHGVLLDVVRHGAVGLDGVVLIRGFSVSPAPHFTAAVLLHLDVHVEHEGGDHGPSEQEVHDLHAAVRVEWLDLPVDVGDGVLLESGDVLEDSPFLGLVEWLLCVFHELCEVAVGISRKSSTQQNRQHCSRHLGNTYLPTISARSVMFGMPPIYPSIPVPRVRKTLRGLSRSYRYSVILIN